MPWDVDKWVREAVSGWGPSAVLPVGVYLKHLKFRARIGVTDYGIDVRVRPIPLLSTWCNPRLWSLEANWSGPIPPPPNVGPACPRLIKCSRLSGREMLIAQAGRWYTRHPADLMQTRRS